MDLIYTTPNLEDIGVIQDYSFDMCYGDRDNTFEVKIQAYNPVISGNYPISFGSYIYVDRTEYGGVVDRIESDTKTGEVTLSGRTWHGILNGCVIEPSTNKKLRTFAGEANSVITEIVTLVGLNSLFEVDTDDSGVYIESTDVMYGLAYDAIREMLNNANAKMYCYFQGGKVHIGAMMAVNYALSDEFDHSQVPFKVGYTYNNVNHIVCLGGIDENEERVVVHLFTDKEGNVMPYIKPGVGIPVKNDDYILDCSQQQLFGKDEISYIYSHESSEIAYYHEPLLTKPSNWNSTYMNYYKGETDETTHETKYTKMKITKGTKMRLLTKEPEGWNSKEKSYEKYYYMTDAEHFQSIKELPDSQAEISWEPKPPSTGFYNKPTDWDSNYTDYWYYDEAASGHYTQLTEQTEDVYNLRTSPPRDWRYNWANYYTREWDGEKYIYNPVEPIRKYTYNVTTKKPDNWNDNWGNYYIKVTEVVRVRHMHDGTKQKHVISATIEVENYVWKKNVHPVVMEGDESPTQESFITKMQSRWITTREAVDLAVPGLNIKHGKPTWKKGVYYLRYEHQSAPQYVPGTIYQKYSRRIVPTFVRNKYVKRVLDKVPKFKTSTDDPTFTGYWEKLEDQEIIPEWKDNLYYIRYEDRCKYLIEWGLKKLKELQDTSTIDINLNLGASYDVGDIIGATDPVMKRVCEETERQEDAEIERGPRRPILRKIIKIKKEIVSISYEVN